MSRPDLARAVRLAWGAALIAAPRPLISLVAEPSPGAELTARVLGVRHLLMVPLMGRPDDRLRRGISAGVDALHSASMVALAALDRDERVLAGTDAALAAAMGALTLTV